MAQIVDYPLSSTFAGVYQLQAQGTIDTGNNLPDGINGALSIRDGVMESLIYDSDDSTATGIRAEITAPSDGYAERWYRWEFLIPGDFAPTADPVSLMQIHDTPDAGDGSKAVPFCLHYVQPGYLGAYVPVQTLPAEGGNSAIAGTCDLQRNHWYTACLRVKWATDTGGFREFYLDRQPIFRQWDVPTMYADATGPYLKLGCYDSTHNARFGTARAYFRNVAIWSGNDGYETVMGRLPALPAQRVEI